LYLGADGSSSQVIPTQACAMAWDLWLWQNSAAMSSPRWHVRRHGIYGCGRIQQPCHPRAGMCGGMGSMAAAYHCHPYYHETPTLHIGVN